MVRKSKWLFLSIVVGLFFVACSMSAFNTDQSVKAESGVMSSRAVAAPTADSKRITGYFCEWGIYSAHDSYLVTDIPFDKLTHINYAFIGINPSTLAVDVLDPFATLEKMYPGEAWDSPYAGNLGMLRKKKLEYPNLSVLLSVGGWTRSNGFHAAAATAQTRQTSVSNLVAFMVEQGMDGLDIDWEYPGVDRAKDPNDQYDMGAPGGPEDTENYTLFLKELREQLDAQGLKDNRYYQLTVAVGIGYDKIAVTNPGDYYQYVDMINLMTYDMHGGFESTIGHQAPLYTNPADTHEPENVEKYNVDWAVNEFLRLGVPASKLSLGIPFYSRGWDNVSGGWDVDGNGTSDGMFGTGGATLAGSWGIGGQGPYFDMAALEGTAGWEKYTDPISKVSWLYNRTKAVLYTYDDPTSISVKVDYAIAKQLGGIMYWELDGDDWHNGNPLISLIHNKFNTNAPADTVAPSNPGAITVGTVTQNSVALSWGAATDNNAVTGYKISYSAAGQSNGSVVVSGTSKVVTGLAASSTYNFSIVALDAAGNQSVTPVTKSAVTSDPIVDTEAPSEPTNVVVGTVTETSISLSWTASTDNVGVTGYEVLNGTTVVASSTTTSATVTGLTKNTTYTFTVRAKDAAGFKSISSASVSAKTPDVVGPATGAPGGPAIAQTTWNGEANYSIKMNMWWGNNGTLYELLENGTVVYSEVLVDNSPASQSITVNLTNKANGTYEYVGRLTNSFGSTSSATLSYTVTQGSNVTDTEAPSAPGLVTASSITSGSADLSWGASTDNVAVTSYALSWVGGSAIASSTSSTLSGLAPSTAYTVSITAKDAAGNVSPATTVSFTTLVAATDNEAPSAPSAVTASAITTTSADLSWGASSDNVGVVSYALSWAGGSATASTTSASINGLTASTAYTVTVIAKDAAGNVSTSSTVAFTTSEEASGTEWVLLGSYTAGEVVTYLGSSYKAMVTHVAYAQEWNPAAAATLWQAL